MKVIEDIYGKLKIVPLVLCDDYTVSARICETLAETGLTAIGFNILSHGSFRMLEKLVLDFPQIEIGATNIFDAAGFMSASLVGAKFISSSGMNSELYTAVRTRYNDAHFLPGVVTPSEVLESLSNGFKAMNLCPAEYLNGKQLLDYYVSVFPQVKFVVRGGITIANMDDYLIKSNVIGISLPEIADAELIETQNFVEIKRRAKQAIDKARNLLEL